MLIRCRTRRTSFGRTSSGRTSFGRAWGVFCLMTLPGLVSAADEPNPFADWEAVRSSTGITEAAPTPATAPTPADGAALEYFSPSASSSTDSSATPGDADASAGSAASQAAAKRRLKLIDRPNVPSAPRAANFTQAPMISRAPAAKQPTAPAASAAEAAWPASFLVHPSKQDPNGSATAATADGAESGGVIQASAAQVDGAVDSNIQQISAEFFDPESGNPFADFLEGEARSDAAATGAAATGAAAGRVASASDRQSAGASASAPAIERPSSAYGSQPPSANTGAQSPSVTLEWIQHGDFNVGQECRCDLLIRNSSEGGVRNVIAEAIIPDGLQVVGASPGPDATPGSAIWKFAELPAGESRRVELTVVPLGRGGMQMNAFVRFTGFATSVFTVQEPLLQLAVDGPAQVEVGEQVSYVVSVTNPGTGVARNVAIQAAIPEGLEHRRGSLLTIEIGTLNPGESRQAKLSVAAIQGGPQDLAVRASADGELSDQNTTSITVSEPQLSLAVRGPDQRIAGQATDYELVVSNAGNVASNNVRAKYRVPEGYVFVKADRGGKFTEAERTIDWFVGTLKAGSSSTFLVTLRPTSTGTSVHQAGVVSEHGKVSVAEHSTTVEGVAELALSVEARQKQVSVGEEAVFEVRIENNGSRAATGVGLSCELPFGLELLQAAGPSEYIAENGVLVFRSIPTLEPGQSAVFAIQSRCRREGAHNLRVRVASASIAEPLIGEETTTAVSR